MGWIGRFVTAAGVVAILLPPIAALAQVLPGLAFPRVLADAPTFVIGGILLFVVGTAMRVYTEY